MHFKFQCSSRQIFNVYFHKSQLVRFTCTYAIILCNVWLECYNILQKAIMSNSPIQHCTILTKKAKSMFKNYKIRILDHVEKSRSKFEKVPIENLQVFLCEYYSLAHNDVSTTNVMNFSLNSALCIYSTTTLLRGCKETQQLGIGTSIDSSEIRFSN